MKIGIMGSGAVGSFFGSFLTEAGHDVTYIARGAHLAAMHKNGLTIFRDDDKVTVTETFTDRLEALANCELIIFCVKSGDTKETAEKLKGIISPTTYVMSLQNGVSNEEVLLDVFGKERVLSAVVYVQAAVSEPGVVKQSGRFSLVIGAPSKVGQGAVKEFTALFSDANVTAVPSQQVMLRKWKKYLWNLMFNPLSAATDQSVGKILDDPYLKDIARTIGLESVSVAQALGYSLDEENVEEAIQNAEYARTHTTSMLQDIRKGKVTEAEEMVGYLLKKADKYEKSISTTKTIFLLLKSKEHELVPVEVAGNFK